LDFLQTKQVSHGRDEGISPLILRRKIGDYNRDGRSDILSQDSGGI
jgi:hypothetical protein